MRILCLLVVFLLFIPVPVKAEQAVSSLLDTDGSFLNRIRWENGESVISLNIGVSGEDMDLEPFLRTDELLVGRLKLKSLLRELYSTEGNAAGASVLYESGSLAMTDSFSSSSRYGAVLLPFSGSDVSAWLFRANGGQVSGGLAAQNLSPEAPGARGCFETDLALTAGSTAECNASSWFDDEPLLPVQPVINPAIEMRLSSDSSGRTGRGILNPAAPEFSISLSILAAGSLPLYTETDGMIRIFSGIGWKWLKLCGSMLIAGDNYICPSGELMNNSVVAGLSLDFEIKPGNCQLEFGTDFSRAVRRAAVTPSRYIAQKYTLEQEIGFISKPLTIKMQGGYKRDYGENGRLSEQADAGITAKIAIGPCSLTAGYDIKSEAEDGFRDVPSQRVSGGLVFSNEAVKLSLSGRSGDEAGLKAGADIFMKQTELSFDIETDAEWQFGFSVGFDTIW